MKLLFDLQSFKILYKNSQIETITIQNEIMTFQDSLIVRNLFSVIVLVASYTLFFLFASLFFNFFERSRFLQSIQKKDKI